METLLRGRGGRGFKAVQNKAALSEGGGSLGAIYSLLGTSLAGGPDFQPGLETQSSGPVDLGDQNRLMAPPAPDRGRTESLLLLQQAGNTPSFSQHGKEVAELALARGAFWPRLHDLVPGPQLQLVHFRLQLTWRVDPDCDS